MFMRPPMSRFTTICILFLLRLNCAPIFGCSDETTPNKGTSDATLTITYPQSGAFINQTQIMVRNTAQGVDTLKVNGQHAKVVSGKWKMLVNFAEGTAKATASADNAEATIDFVVDTIAPVIELTQPTRGLMRDDTSGNEVVFAGRVSEKSSGLKVLGLDGTGIS